VDITHRSNAGYTQIFQSAQFHTARGPLAYAAKIQKIEIKGSSSRAGGNAAGGSCRTLPDSTLAWKVSK
jgi:hypothetical protein